MAQLHKVVDNFLSWNLPKRRFLMWRAVMCRFLGHDWFDGYWYNFGTVQDPIWRCGRLCKRCDAHEHHEIIGGKRPLDIW